MSASPRRATSRNGFRFQILRVLPSFLLSFLPRRSCQTDWRRRRHAMQQRDDHRGVSSLAFRHRSPCPFGDGPRKGPQIYEMKVLLCRAIRHGERRISWSAVAFPFRSRITPTPLPRIEASYPSTIGKCNAVQGNRKYRSESSDSVSGGWMSKSPERRNNGGDLSICLSVSIRRCFPEAMGHFMANAPGSPFSLHSAMSSQEQ